jgi:hypothetical protein
VIALVDLAFVKRSRERKGFFCQLLCSKVPSVFVPHSSGSMMSHDAVDGSPPLTMAMHAFRCRRMSEDVTCAQVRKVGEDGAPSLTMAMHAFRCRRMSVEESQSEKIEVHGKKRWILKIRTGVSGGVLPPKKQRRILFIRCQADASPDCSIQCVNPAVLDVEYDADSE